ncbi:protein FAR1-RELATED SEQUENCE 1-like [Chenopodium quinoa]|uniref:protein FAR1-RELATED SEQUENCE 1-like n=1 Tax=Chenopodium quinoa TaxID=63459 RepID=UPI000B76C954|nr:protein FAR1-RELATED SEQUENCE 1-like [Chenopodium quinoa]
MRYETALDAQRHCQAENDNESQKKFPQCKTELLIVRHGSEVYTVSVFYEFQDDVHSAFYCCGVDELRKEDGIDVAIVTEANRRRKFKVLFECFSHDTTCSCKKFYRIGIPCRHMIWMWKAKNLKSIPKQYILDRWTITATQKPVLDISCLDTEDDRRVVINEMWSEIFSCVSWVKGHEEDFIKNIREFKNKIEATKNVTLEDTQNVRSSEHDIEMLIECSIPDEILVQPPKVSKNKGTGVHDGSGTSGSKRLKGAKEIAVEQSKKKTKRKCSGCGELAYHDIRNCPHKA